jgi:ethanolamine ammonia-lyase large subunit
VIVAGERFTFGSLVELLAKANEQKSGDALIGVAAGSERERAAAKVALSEVRLSEIVGEPVVDDEVTDAFLAAHDADGFAAVASLTVGELREMVLGDDFPSRWESALQEALVPEIVAAVTKLMSDLELVSAASRLRVVSRCRNTQGELGVLGVRIQPSDPRDDLQSIVCSALEGLRSGCGDAVLAVSPAAESVRGVKEILCGLDEMVRRTGVPTQICVLAHMSTQLDAMQAGAPVDMLFQSVAGSRAANAVFGLDLALLHAGRSDVLAHHADRPGEFVGDNVMYFETGQGNALSAHASLGVDQLTMEARAQGVARLFDPFLVNSVVSFVGPEALADTRQVTRAVLEDHFMGKLQGLPMGSDVCYLSRSDADQSTNDGLLVLLAAAGCNFVIGFPTGDDAMVDAHTTSYADAATVRRLLGLRPAPEFDAWLGTQPAGGRDRW